MSLSTNECNKSLQRRVIRMPLEHTYLPGVLGTLYNRPMFPPVLRLAFLIFLARANVQTNDVPSFGCPTDSDDSHDIWIVLGHLLHERADIKPVME